MRNRNKLLSLLLAMVLALGLTGAAFAAEGKGYADVENHWGKEYIDAVMEKGLIDGKTASSFAPDEDMTRADLVLALYRLAGSPANAVDAQDTFADVADDAKYKDAVLWAYGQGIIAGKTADTFAPDGSVLRQEIAKILNVFAAGQVGKDGLTSRKDMLSAYPDAGDVASWAKEPMNWAAASEFITGTSGGRLDPTGTATRAQVSAILCRYMEDASTGDASKDDPRNQDGIGENELLVVSFGTSFNDNRAATIKAVEDAMEEAFPAYSVRRGFTADTIIEHVYRRDGQEIDSVKQALDRAKANGVKNLLVQPTHLMNGYEYGDLVKQLNKRAADFETIKIGAPLLTSDQDFTEAAQAMIAATKDLTDGKTAVCYMGHGTEAASNGVYARMQEAFKAAGHNNYFVGTVEAAPTAEDLVKLVKEGGYEKVILRPMMIVAGDHANNDMAGDAPDSWKSVFTAAGLEVQCEIKGLGELASIQQMLVDHAKSAKTLAESEKDIAVQPNPENPDNEDGEPVLADGVYTVHVDYEGMFKVYNDSCRLTVKDGKMTAELVLDSTSFDKMYVGTAAMAQSAQEGIVQGTETDGRVTFILPVEALDQALEYAAHSVRKDAWYDRVLTFEAPAAE